METNNNTDCPPFSKCWCEKHPNGATHPHCQEVLPLGSVYLDITVILAVGYSFFVELKRKTVK